MISARQLIRPFITPWPAQTVILVVVVGLLLPACSKSRKTPSQQTFVRDCTVHLVYRPTEVVGEVRLKGSWHANDHQGDLLVYDARLGGYRISFLLSPGTYTYALRVDGIARLDPKNPLSRFVGAFERSELRVADCSLPKLVVESTERTADGRLSMIVQFWKSSSQEPLDPGSLVATIGAESKLDVELLDGGSRFKLTRSGLEPGKYWLSIKAADLAGRQAGTLRFPVWIDGTDRPFSWNDALIYQLLIDRFKRSKPLDGGTTLTPTARHGGDLAGLLQILESGYFEGLGVNVLWISPLNDNPEGFFDDRNGSKSQGYHGYWPQKPRSVESMFGDAELVERFVREAHKRGIRVVMDLVLNHLFVEHPYYQQHSSWFRQDRNCVCGAAGCSWGEFILDCQFTDFLPDLDWRNPEVMQQQVDDAMWWLERFDLDGLRLDAVPMMPRLAIRQLADRVHRTLEHGGTRIYLVGEIFTDKGGYQQIRYYLGPDSLDGAFQFPLMWAMRLAFAQRSIPMWQLHGAVENAANAYRLSTAVMAPFVSNHDVARFLSEAAGDFLGDPFDKPPALPTDAAPYRALVMANALVLTLPGAPVIYYGDEFGMPGAGDPDNRRMMRFGDELTSLQKSVLDDVGKLGRLRRCLSSLRHGSYRMLLAEQDQYVFLRDSGDGFPALILFNRSGTFVALTVKLPGDLKLDHKNLVDRLSGSSATVTDGTLEVTIGADSVAVMLPRSSSCL